ncbi:MAG: VWA domain-containing protein [Hyphomicrobiaceae bacterium]
MRTQLSDFARNLIVDVARGLAVMIGMGGAAFASPAAPVEIKAELDRSVLPLGKTHKGYLRISVTPARRAEARRALMNVALVIDRSGSMSSQGRMANARRAAKMAVDRLGADDILSVVSYDDRIEVDVPATKVLDSADVKARIERLSPRGSTAIHAALLAAANEVRKFKAKDRVNRIVLISDGLANVGPSKPSDFERLGHELASEGITVSTIGLGTGYNEDLMAGLARSGDGGHVFVQESADLAAFLAREFDDVAATAGQEAEIIIKVKDGIRPLRALGREARIEGDRIVYRVGALYGGVEQVLISEIAIDPATSAGEATVAEVEAVYTEPANGARIRARGSALVRFDTDEVASQKSVNPSVMRDVTTLVSRAARQEAVKLRDAGRLDEARARFRSNAAYLRKQQSVFDKGGSHEPLAKELKASEAAAAATNMEQWSTARKVQRATDSNSFGASQKY